MAVVRGLLMARVMHRRLIPKPHRLAYRVYYLCLPVRALASARNRLFSINRFNLFAYHERDHGFGEAGNAAWAERVLTEYGAAEVCSGEIELITLPRVLGYGFNPVSFWLCRDDAGALRAVIAEVNNTFGERHAYFLAQEDFFPMTEAHWVQARKIFHVSPFLQVTGEYRFRFHDGDENTGIWIDYYGEEGQLVLQTSLIGRRYPLTAARLLGCFVRFPWLTVGIILRIHLHAMRMMFKGFTYFRKPPLTAPEVSR